MKLETIIKKNNNKNILEVVARLKAGEVIGLPTETVYGLAGNAYSDDACRKIFYTPRNFFKFYKTRINTW